MAQESRLKKGKCVDACVDLISDMPRGVIDTIMKQLPLRDAARMSVLSHKWLEIWTSIQQLDFDAHFFSTVLREKLYETHEFCRVVSKILFHHEGHILKFSLYVPPLNHCPDVNQWICYLSRTGVTDFSLNNQYKMPLKLSSRIFSCVNLEKLKLHHCVLNPPPSFGGYRKLVSLELDKILIREKAFNNLVMGSPHLQKLRLTNFMGMDHIIIDAPNLSRLIVDGTFISIDVRNAANLLSALIGLQKWVKFCHKASLRALVQGFANSCKTEKLCFRGHFCKVLYKESLLPTSFESLKTLDLASIHLNDLDDFAATMSFIRSCPNIEKLNIYVRTSKNLNADVLAYNVDFVLHHLLWANVGICCGSSTELKLIEILLACSPLLEKLSVTSTGSIKSKFRSRVVMQLIRFRRASQKVEVICPEPIFSVCLDNSGADSSPLSEDTDGSGSD